MQWALVPIQTLWVMIWKDGRFRTPEVVGRDLVWCCWNSDDTLGKNPRAVYLNGRTVSDSSPESHEVEKQRLLWGGSVKLCGLEEGETVLKDWK